ncbi:MAG: histidine kinase dimerization/phospho-acceptor domain-containing protein [Nannocystaceae bacterium]
MPSLHRRLARTVLGATAPVLFALSLATDWLVSRMAWQQFDDALASRTRDLSTLLEREPDRYEFEYDERFVPEYAAGDSAFFEIRRRADGSVIARSSTLGDHALPFSPTAPPGGEIADVMLPSDRHARAMTLRFVPRLDEDISSADAPRYQDEVVLVVAVASEATEAALTRVRTWLWALCGLSLAVAAYASVAAVRRGLRPLDRVAIQLQALAAARLGARLALEQVPDELRRPLEQVNALLGRIEESFARERRFTADVSHELRTPLAAVRAVLELAVSRPRESPEYAAAIRRALATLEPLTRMVERLLVLARAEAGAVAAAVVPVSLHAMVEERWLALRATAQRRELGFENRLPIDESFPTDEAAMVVVVGNLLDNAAAYTERGGRVLVHRPPGTVLEVWDSGPVPDAVARARMFDRLWREDVARSGDGAHAGLGLPLARGMARALGLDVVATASDGGLGLRVVQRSGDVHA